MPEIATISAILTSFKTATDIAKLLKDSSLSLEEAETKLKLAELISSLADAKMEVAQIQEILLEKDQRIKTLEEELILQSKMVWHAPVYYRQLTEGGEEGPFCPQCYDSNKKVIRLQTHPNGFWHCMTCDKEFFSQDYNSRISF